MTGAISLSRGFWIWSIWLAYFLVFEAIGLSTKQSGDTLSEYVWGFRKMTGGEGVYTLFMFILLWMIWHFWLEQKR